MKLRSRVVGPLLVVLALLVAGCGGGGGGGSGGTSQAAAPPASPEAPNTQISGQLNIWGWEAATNALKVVDADFAKAYPNVKVRYKVLQPADTYRNLQLASAAGSGFPDISVIEDSHLAQFVKQGVLADLTERVRPYVGKMNAYKWTQAQKGDRYFAMPWDSGPVAVFYRQDIFAKAGVDPATIRTWDDYYQAARTIKQKTGVPMWPQPKARNDARVFEMLLWQQGLGYVDPGGNVVLDKDPRAVQTLEFMGRFWREGLSLDTEWWTDPWYKAFADGKVASIPEAVWMGTFFKSFIAPKAVGKWGVFQLPAWQAGGSQMSNDGGSSLAILAGSKQQDAAWAYVQFHLGVEKSQVAMYEKADIFPSLETTYADPIFQQPDPYFGGQKVRGLFAGVVKEIPKAGIYTADYQQMNAILQTEVQKYALGQKSAEQALRDAAAAIRSRTGRA